MPNTDVLWSIVFSLFWAAACITASHYKQDFDPRWLTAVWAGVIGIHAFYIALYLRGVEESLKKLYALFVDREEHVKPELHGAVQYLKERLVETFYGRGRRRG
jgi:hypothetical protein